MKQKGALTFIFITLLIDCLGIGIIIPILPTLIQHLTHSDISHASGFGGELMVAYSLTQFLFAPAIGNLSDRFGRRPILLLSLLGLGVDYLFMAFAPSIGWLFAGRIVAGIFGASFTTASAYIADISTPEQRAQNFGMIGAAFGIGFMLGPLAGGLLSRFGHQAPFIAAACLSLLNMLYGYFILPESLKPELRRRFEWKRANPVGALLDIRKYPANIGLFVATALLFVAGHAAQSTWSFITMEKFHWDSAHVGYSLSVVGLLTGLVQGGLIRVIIPKLGQKNSVFVGLFLYLVGFVLFGVATRSWMMYAFLIPYCLGGISMPAIQGIISLQVPPTEQGALQGVMTSLMSLASIVGPLLMTQLFGVFTRHPQELYLPSAPFYMGALLTVASIAIAYLSISKWHVPEV